MKFKLMAVSLILVVAIFDLCWCSKCNDKRDCVSCVKKKSWNRKPCRWCPRDGECHAYGSARNKCSKKENIKREEDCRDDPKTSRYRYDPNLGYKMLIVSAAAYDSSDPQKCLAAGLSGSDFQVLDVFTRKCDIVGNECSGYVALSHKERAIVVAFRGTTTTIQGVTEFIQTLVEPKTDFLRGEVQTYWLDAYDKLWRCMEPLVAKQLKEHPGYQTWVTGYSLGGTIASLASARMVYDRMVSKTSMVLYTFGMPRVGNKKYALQHEELVPNSWRVVNYRDIVPHFPTYVGINPFNAPRHHGIEVYYKGPRGAVTPNSPYKICRDFEQSACSWSDNPTSITKHKQYFSLSPSVGEYCHNLPKKRSTTSATEFQFTADHCSVYRYNASVGYYMVSQMKDVKEEDRVDVKEEDRVDVKEKHRVDVKGEDRAKTNGSGTSAFIVGLSVISVIVLAVVVGFLIYRWYSRRERIPYGQM